MIHKMDLRIYYQDTDAGGIVYHSNYLDYAERARSEFLRDVGLPVNDLLERDVAFVIKKAELTYKSPARLDDLLTVHTSIGDIKGASMIMNQTIKRGETDLVEIVLQVVFVSPKTMAPIRIPADLKEKFTLYQGE
ncbi:MAG: tol-pal system-associated acyl-CoA thioesterase [Alphaproteobacteria bacterium]|nr:tol-pal system-associated acyl-CoA thioesterase [Alphaproteobacteria bacterium]